MTRVLILMFFLVTVMLPATGHALFSEVIDSIKKESEMMVEGIDASMGGVFGATSEDKSARMGGWLEGTGLYNIFEDHPYDDSVDFSKQYPRVAITVVKAPPIQAKPCGYGSSWKSGEYELQLDVWYSKSDHKTFTDLHWSSPNNIQQGVALKDCWNWILYSGVKGSQTKFERNAKELSTGLKRTTGPVPPYKPVPEDRRHKAFLGASSNFNTNHYNGVMLASVIYQLGFDWNNTDDRRIWLVGYDEAMKR